MRNLILATIAGLTVSAAANAAPAHYPLTAAVGGQPTAAEAVAIRRDLGSSFGKEWTDYEKTGHRIGFTVGHADLNGDGKADIVLIWAAIGPTYGYYKMSVFLDQGRNYRTLTTDLGGDVQKLAVQGQTIVVDLLTMGPNDPRCCPSVKAQRRFQWTGQKLVMLK